MSVPWADAPAEDVLEKVIKPLEEELSTVRGVDRLNSFSTTGFGRVFMSFKSGTDMDVAYREVRDRIERARARLPEDAKRITIRKDDQSGIPVFVMGLAVDPDLADPYNLIQNEVVMRIERLDGVASVEVNGLLEKEIFIELDRERTEASGLNVYQLAQALGRDNFTMASGDVRAGEKKLLRRSVARFRDIEQLRNLKVAPRVRLGDVADVAYKPPEQKFRVRANSRPAVALCDPRHRRDRPRDHHRHPHHRRGLPPGVARGGRGAVLPPAAVAAHLGGPPGLARGGRRLRPPERWRCSHTRPSAAPCGRRTTGSASASSSCPAALPAEV